MPGTYFRFVFEDLSHQNNFRPPLAIKPTRVFEEAELCSANALSIFSEEDRARAFYVKLRSEYPKIHKTIGSHLARVAIAADDGSVGEEDADGHRDFHEFEDCNLFNSAELLGALV
jgi:hypothetical protein